MKRIFTHLVILFICLTKGLNTINADTIPTLEFSEVSFKNTNQDYIKIHINRPPENSIQINDDKTILEISPSQITSQKELIIFFKATRDEIKETTETLKIHITKKGLTATTEQLTITENNQIIDYVCWQNSKIAQSEQEDLVQLQLTIPDLSCLNSEEVKTDGTIKKSENVWKIINPEKKKKSSKTKPTTIKTKAPTTSQKSITDLSDLEIQTQNLSINKSQNHSSEILIATITIVLSLGLILGTSSTKKPRS